jgi:hypothetical protein
MILTHILNGLYVFLTSTLTTSIENVTGNDLAIVGTGATFQAGDTINVTGKANSLTISDSTGASASGVPAGVTVAGVQTMNVNATGIIGGSAVAGAAQATTITLGTSEAPVKQTTTYTFGTAAGVATQAFTYGGANGSFQSATVAATQATQFAAAVNAVSGTAGLALVGSTATATGATGASTIVVVSDITATAKVGQTVTGTNVGSGAVITAVGLAGTTTTLTLSAVNGGTAVNGTVTIGGGTGAVTVFAPTAGTASPAIAFGAVGSAGSVPTESLTVANTPSRTVNFTYNGVAGSYTESGVATTDADNLAAAIQAIAGSSATVTSPTNTVVITSNTLGVTTLPAVSFTAGSGATSADLPTQANTAGVAPGTNAQYNVSGFAGLTQFTAQSIGGENIKAAATTSLSLTDTALGAGTITAIGGNNVSVVARGVASTGASTGTITIGSATTADQPGGTVNVTATGTAGGSTIGPITVNGGTVVTVTQGAAASAAAGTGSTTQGAVTVNGSLNTTSVTVNQAGANVGAAAANAVVGVAAVTAVPAAPGVDAVTGVTGVNRASAVTAVNGATTGNTTIVDKSFGTTTANTITSVSLTNLGTTVAIDSNALTTLSLSGTTGAGNITAGSPTQFSTVTLRNATSGTSNPTTTTGTLTVNVNGLGQYVNIGSATAAITALVDGSGSFSTVNLVSSGARSTLSLSGSNIGAINISGTAEVIAPLVTTNALLAVTVTGAAGFNDNNKNVYNATSTASTLGNGLTLTSTSSGIVTASLNALTQSFSGSSTGTSVITVNGAAQTGTFNTVAGNGANDKLIIDTAANSTTGTAYGLTSAQIAKLTGFEQIAITKNVTGTVNLANLAPTVNLVEILGGTTAAATGALSVTNIATGAALQINASAKQVLSFGYAATSVDSATLTLGRSTNSTEITVDRVGIVDSSGGTINTLNVVSNNSTWTSTGVAPLNIISRLDNLTLGALNVTGNAGLTVTALDNNGTNTASTFNLANNTTTAGTVVTMTRFIDNALTTLNMGGTGNTVITKLESSTTNLTITDTNAASGSVVIGSNGSTTGFLQSNTTLTNLTLNGNIQIGTNTDTAAGAIGAATGITVSGATNNAHVNIQLNAADAGKTNTVTLGNGNNFVTDLTVAGSTTITVGTGSNIIDVQNASTTTVYFATVTLGADVNGVNPDVIFTSVMGTSVNTYNTRIVGIGQGDVIDVATDIDTGTTVTLVTGTILSVADGIAAVKAAVTNTLGSFQFGGDTYLVAEATSGADVSVIQLVGVHTFGAVDATANSVVLLS